MITSLSPASPVYVPRPLPRDRVHPTPIGEPALTRYVCRYCGHDSLASLATTLVASPMSVWHEDDGETDGLQWHEGDELEFTGADLCEAGVGCSNCGRRADDLREMIAAHDLHVGDRVHCADGYDGFIEAIEAYGEEAVAVISGIEFGLQDLRVAAGPPTERLFFIGQTWES